jgi:hypothetical protein
MTAFSKPLSYPGFTAKHPPSKRTILLLLGTVLLLRALPGRALHTILTKAASGSRRKDVKGKGRALPDDDLRTLQQQIYEEDEHGRTWLLVPYEDSVQKVLFSSQILITHLSCDCTACHRRYEQYKDLSEFGSFCSNVGTLFFPSLTPLVCATDSATFWLLSSHDTMYLETDRQTH